MFAHQFCFAEMLTRLASGEAVETLESGTIPAGDLVKAAILWQHDLAVALSGSYLQTHPVPDAVHQEYLQTTPLFSQRLGAQPAIISAKEMNNLFIKEPQMPPKFTWSYTALQEFLTCPFQWAQKRYYKTLKEAPSEAMQWGSDAHKALENALKAVQFDLPARFKGLGWEKYLAPLLGAKASGAKLLTEQQLALDANLTPCSWFGKDAWGRGVIDVGVLKGDNLTVIDWKTGKVKDDQLQLRVFCAFAAQHYPEVNSFNAKFIWLKEADPRNAVTGLAKPISRSEIPEVWAEILGHVRRMEEAWASENFRMQSNGLCKNWCGATSCPHCGRK